MPISLFSLTIFSDLSNPKLRAAFETLSHSLSLSDDISSYSGPNALLRPLKVKADTIDHNPVNGLRKEDYPLVNFWTQEDFKKWDSAADAQGDQRGSLPFLEHTNGDPVTPSKQRAIMKTFRAVWFGLQQRGIAPISWGRAIPDARNALYKEVSRIHPELTLCDRYWKIEHVARDRYPSWASTHLKEGDSSSTDHEETKPCIKQQKRKAKMAKSADTCPKHDSKRVKTADMDLDSEVCNLEPPVISSSNIESPIPSSSSSTTLLPPLSLKPKPQTKNPPKTLFTPLRNPLKDAIIRLKEKQINESCNALLTPSIAPTSAPIIPTTASVNTISVIPSADAPATPTVPNSTAPVDTTMPSTDAPVTLTVPNLTALVDTTMMSANAPATPRAPDSAAPIDTTTPSPDAPATLTTPNSTVPIDTNPSTDTPATPTAPDSTTLPNLPADNTITPRADTVDLPSVPGATSLEACGTYTPSSESVTLQIANADSRGIVLPQFGSEPQFEPEPFRTGLKFCLKVLILAILATRMHHHLWQANQHPHNTTGAISLMSDISIANPRVFLVAGGSGVTFTFSLRDDIVSRTMTLKLRIWLLVFPMPTYPSRDTSGITSRYQYRPLR
ncbi:hypothetical protein BDR06DRAFT_1073448 [Suillus hirtellus]|nr:hypothetical protein BDR06DRAFT_1073448 [Suillus hirtellus]